MEVAPFFVDFHHFLSIFTIFYRLSRFTHFCRALHFVAIYALFPHFFLAKIAFSATSHVFCMYGSCHVVIRSAIVLYTGSCQPAFTTFASMAALQLGIAWVRIKVTDPNKCWKCFFTHYWWCHQCFRLEVMWPAPPVQREQCVRLLGQLSRRGWSGGHQVGHQVGWWGWSGGVTWRAFRRITRRVPRKSIRERLPRRFDDWDTGVDKSNHKGDSNSTSISFLPLSSSSENHFCISLGCHFFCCFYLSLAGHSHFGQSCGRLRKTAGLS